jgi:hypothetical protein
VYSGTVLALAMKEILRGYIVEMYDGTKVRFDDGTEAYAYVKTLELGSWARLYGDVDREAEKECYCGQTKKLSGPSSKIESAPLRGKPSKR